MEKASIKIHYYKSPFGELILGSWEESLCLCDWRYRRMRDSIDKRITDSLRTSFIQEKTALHMEVIRQLEEYFRRERKDFELPSLLIGSVFQKKVWKLLLDIPYGAIETYAGLSSKLGDPGAVRAVASANGANALALIVPCHRVIGSDGNLTGYAGGLKAKKDLLNLERALDQMELDFS